ncbi:PEP-CTERM sorting domain-containing protein [Oscillatoria sp. FACHB-1407]|uniref:Vgb family protein n=1 Tax=Oscillatoria sp. FACHB-1407 TaxID=2692847 RepID=UPI001687AB1B|nr:PEP-CTERM sorting domain-containing protein [Oscillatoria sp. FACHB-1407]MBD2464649.1 PEP-CTERM sorting domain-containing protein [Oscillatoria sp. FACHB-1407]
MKKSFLGLSAATSLGVLASFGIGVPQADAALLVGNTRGNNVLIFDERSGTFGGEFIPAGTGGLQDPDDLTFGPDGNLYITSGSATSGAILKFDGETGEFLGRFDQGGTLLRPYGLAFGPDNKVYVSSFLTDEILRYDAVTGEFIDVFASGAGTVNGLNGPNDLLFGADGSLFVTTQGSVRGSFSVFYESQVLKYDIATGASSVFVPQPEPSPESFGFVSFLGLTFGPDGDLFTSDFANGIRRYDEITGELIDTISTNYTGTIPSNNFIGNLTFDPNNILYSVGFDFTQGNQGAILRFDGETGDPLPSDGQSSSVFVPTNPLLRRPIGIAYSPIVVPEPGLAIALLVLGAAGVASRTKRDRSNS